MNDIIDNGVKSTGKIDDILNVEKRANYLKKSYSISIFVFGRFLKVSIFLFFVNIPIIKF